MARFMREAVLYLGEEGSKVIAVNFEASPYDLIELIAVVDG